MASTGENSDISVGPDTAMLSDGGVDADPDPDPGLLIDLSHDDSHWGALDAFDTKLKSAAAILSTLLGASLSHSTAVVALSSDAEVQRLNADWRGRDKATNVLSFPSPPLQKSPCGRRFLGDVVLARETVEREASAEGIPLEHHAIHLSVHGVLHLIGYDHEAEDEAERMESLEVEVLARLGIPHPYQ